MPGGLCSFWCQSFAHTIRKGININETRPDTQYTFLMQCMERKARYNSKKWLQRMFHSLSTAGEDLLSLGEMKVGKKRTRTPRNDFPWTAHCMANERHGNHHDDPIRCYLVVMALRMERHLNNGINGMFRRYTILSMRMISGTWLRVRGKG